MPFELAQARLDWTELAASHGRGDPEPAARASLATFEQLGAKRYIQRARRLLRDLGARVPVARRPRPAGAALSARELEVARLAADGLTTAQIAQRLMISPRTAGTHLNRIYARLGINSRAALTRYVVESQRDPLAKQAT